MFEQPWVFVDIETNGGHGARGRIIEIAAIKVIDGAIIDEYRSLVNPGESVPYWITRLTGINDSDLVHAPYFDEIAATLSDFLTGCIFVAHNVLFDYSFIKRELEAAGYVYQPKLYCTVKMSRALYPEHRGHSLEKIIARHGIQPTHRHRAYDDAKAIYEFALLALREKGYDALRANVVAQLKTRSLPPHVDHDLILSLPESPGVYIFEDDAGMVLYVGKSINIRARVKAHFTSATAIAREMKMALASHNIRYISTETELEALLLESAKVKELQPVFNRKLRRKKTQHIIVRHTDRQGYLGFTIESQDLADYAKLDRVYGVYTTRIQAKNALESACRSYQLCPKLLGLEKSLRFCFRYQLGLCKGACGGLESAAHYNQRVEFALERMRIEAWPYDSKILLPISATRSIVIDQWVPLGIYDTQDESYASLSHSFDIDTYKILRSFIRLHRARVTRLDDHALAALDGVM